MNAYDLTLQFIRATDNLQRALDAKQANKDVNDIERLDANVQNAEDKMMEIKNKLKNIEL